MLTKPVSFLKGIISKGHHRSVKAKKNIIASFFLRGISIAVSLIVVPITIDYIDKSRYGIWLTISSIVAWFSFFDIGLSQGLRNKFAAAKANGDDELAQSYVSTTYAILAIIFTVVWGIFMVVNFFLDWSKILHLPPEYGAQVSTLAVIVFTYFCLQFIFKIINTLILANQEPAKASLIDVVGQVLSLVFIFILVKTTSGSLVKLGIALCLAPLLTLLVANFYFFRGVFKKYRPRISKVNFSYAKGLFNLGMAFFVIQIAAIIQYQTANFIIARNFSTADVTSYNIVFKYFGILNMVSVIFLTPFWSASTEAYVKNDIAWIRNAIRKYNRLNILLIITGSVMLVFSAFIYRAWLGKGTVQIDFSLSLWGFIYFSLMTFTAKYVYFLNGINALRLQFIASLFSPFLYIGVTILLLDYFHMGVYALFIASVIANFNGYLLAPFQYHQIVIKNKKGIWAK